MSLKMRYVFSLLLIFTSLAVSGQGKVNGIIINKSDKTLFEYAHVEVCTANDKQLIDGAVTDANGRFEFNKLPFGEYELSYSFIGFVKTEGIRFTVSRDKSAVNLGTLELEEAAQELNEVVISAQTSTYINKIDRKVFNVGEDLMSSSGSASDLMQNIPSVQVDIEGNVSLRGSDNVMILINGRISSLVRGANRATALQQIPANTIERIEVITNPSARYKPDGTSGIINIVLKKEKRADVNGTWAANAGNNNRYNSTITLNYNPGKINFFGSYGLRFDDQSRYTSDHRTRMFSETGALTFIDQNTESKTRTVSHVVRGGMNWDITKKNNLEVSGVFTNMSFRRDDAAKNIYQDQNLNLTSDYSRFRDNEDREKDVEIEGIYTHTFDKDHEFSLEFTLVRDNEREDNKYKEQYFFPIKPDEYDNTYVRKKDSESLIRSNYSRPLGEDGTLEAGLDFELNKMEIDLRSEYLKNMQWITDSEKTNQFAFDENIYALYATCETELGDFGVKGGMRGEYCDYRMNQKTQGITTQNSYYNFYPTLHTAYSFNNRNEMQFNYSLRVKRPDGDDLNPFAEWRDPLNVSTGNPSLKPEKTHSIEMGYLFREDIHTFIATAYHRYTFNRMTSVTEYGYNGNPEVMWTRLENLSSSRSSGIEFIANSGIEKAVRFNLSTNVFYNTIDASRLGYSKNKSTIAWNAALNANFTISNDLMAQLNTRYTAKTLTPQGYREPSFIMNLGARYHLFNKKASLIFTVSDVFNTFKQVTIIDRPELLTQIGQLDDRELLVKQRVEHKRKSQIFYIGFVLHFGKTQKKAREDSFKYDEGI